MTTSTERQSIQIGHSPDPDDAFMWYPLANFPDNSGPGGLSYTPKVDTGHYDFVHVLEDIQSLNERSEQGELEITALSIHQYPFIADKYALTSCGSSMGDGYGPMVVAPENFDLVELFKGGESKPGQASGQTQGRKRIAIPGERTSAWLSLQLLLHEQGLQGNAADAVDFEVVMFDEIIPRVLAGDFDAGLIIHEGQLTYANDGLECVADLGKWWTGSRQLPLPLGGNAIRRDLGEKPMGHISRILLDSIEYALNNREASVEYALNYARDMGAELADEFVGMYVNKWTLDYGQQGRAAVKQLLTEATKAGIIPEHGEIDFVDPA